MKKVLIIFLVTTSVAFADLEKPKTEPDKVAEEPTNVAVTLAPIVVKSPIKSEHRKKEEELLKDLPFTIKDGGTLVKHRGRRVTTELKFQFNSAHRGWDILSFSR